MGDGASPQPTAPKTFLRATPDGTEMRVKVQPRARRDEIDSIQEGELKIRVTAPPVDSAANEAVCDLIAETLGCRRGDVKILRGLASRHKTIQVSGLSPADILSRLPSG